MKKVAGRSFAGYCLYLVRALCQLIKFQWRERRRSHRRPRSSFYGPRWMYDTRLATRGFPASTVTIFSMFLLSRYPPRPTIPGDVEEELREEHRHRLLKELSSDLDRHYEEWVKSN